MPALLATVEPNLLIAGIAGLGPSPPASCRSPWKIVGLGPSRRCATPASMRRLIACQMTVDLFGWQKDEFMPGIAERAGVASYLASAKEANVTLCV